MSNAEALRRLAQQVISSSDTSDKIHAHTLAEDDGLNREKLHERIVTVLKGHTDGIKIIQLAELMGIKNWRSLIPVMRELLDRRILGKVGSRYFVKLI